jgi:putative hydrolase of the HAD superfamily
MPVSLMRLSKKKSPEISNGRRHFYVRDCQKAADSPIRGAVEINALLFDLDDTLIVDEAVSREALHEVALLAAKQHGVDPGRFARIATAEAARLWKDSPVYGFCRNIGISAFECLWGNFEGQSPQITALREWAHPFRRRVFEAALREQLIDPADGPEILAKAFESTRRKLQRLMPDAIETLARLKPDYRLGLLTNGAPDLQREKLSASGLEPFFDAVAISGEHGMGKPRPEIFHELLSALDVGPSSAVMIGNSLERDILGAANAGILSVWIRVPGSEEHADTTPNHTITGLSDLEAVLREINAH